MLEIKNIEFEYEGYCLRRLEEAAANENYLRWVNDPEVNEFLVLRHQEHSIESLREYIRSNKNNPSRDLFGVYDVANNKHIGNTSIYGVDFQTGVFDIGYFIGEKEYWGKNSGMATSLLTLRIAFDELKLRKIFTYIEATNLRSRFVMQRLKFEKEAILKDHRLGSDGELVNTTIYSLTRENWEEKTKKTFFKQ